MSNIGNTICKVGRNFDPGHATCKSCVRQLGRCTEGRKRPVAVEHTFTTRGAVFVTTKPLHSMNHWHGRPAWVYQSYKREWRKLLAGTWALWGNATGKRTLIVTRFVTSKGHLIADADNRIGAIKPVKDILVEIGVLSEDTDNDVTFEVRQFIDRATPRTEIFVEDI